MCEWTCKGRGGLSTANGRAHGPCLATALATGHCLVLNTSLSHNFSVGRLVCLYRADVVPEA